MFYFLIDNTLRSTRVFVSRGFGLDPGILLGISFSCSPGCSTGDCQVRAALILSNRITY